VIHRSPGKCGSPAAGIGWGSGVAAALLLTAISALAHDADSHPGHISASISLSPSAVTIGVPIRCEVRVEHSKELLVEIPDLAPVLSDFEIRNSGKSVARKLLKGRLVKSRWYDLVTYSVGEHVVPWPEISYAEKGVEDAAPRLLPGAPLVLRVSSLLDEGATEIRDIKPPLDLPAPRWPYAIAAVIAVLALAAVTLFIILRRRRKRAEPPPIPPHEIAYAELDRLAAISPGTIEEMAEFYYRLSLCVRRYIEARFGIRAPSQTTQEFLAALAASESALGPHAELLKEFLTHCDAVKFARHYPLSGETDAALASARRFVDETTPKPEEAALEVASK